MTEVNSKSDNFAAIDPYGTLPTVNLMPVEQPQSNERYVYQSYEITSERKSSIGRMLLGPRKSVGKCRTMSEVATNERWFVRISVGNNRGKGYGTAAYLEAISKALKEGYSFRTHKNSIQSKDAKRVWERLAAAGIARVIMPFQELGPEAGAYAGEYEGHYTVEPERVAEIL